MKKVITMDMIGKIRRMHRRGKKTKREIARATGLSRNTVYADHFAQTYLYVVLTTQDVSQRCCNVRRRKSCGGDLI